MMCVTILKVTNVNNRKELVLNRKAWNDLAENAETHKGKLMEDKDDEEEAENIYINFGT